MKQFENISPTVIALGVVSFFTDLSSEMIYPLLPIFLSSVLGAGAFALGLIEGIADATASILKIISGYLTDRAGKRKPFVLSGYSLSFVVRPFIGLATVWPVVLVLRFIDRAGKGIRTSPRDALIADVTDSRFTGRAYGFHRAMDHAGAVLGPLAAVLLLKGVGLSLRSVFLLSAVPAAVVLIVVIFFVKEDGMSKSAAIAMPKAGSEIVSRGESERISAEESGRVSEEESERAPDQKSMGSDFKLFLLAVVTFTLGNSTDAFLLLRLNTAGVDVASTALLWSLFHVVKMVSTYTGGRISDRVGRKPMIITGWVYYAFIYLMFALFTSKGALICIFLLYGVYFGLTEPVEKAWVVSFVPHDLRGRAFGYYHGAIGIASLPTSLLFGFIWQTWGYYYAFITGSIFALSGCVLISIIEGK